MLGEHESVSRQFASASTGPSAGFSFSLWIIVTSKVPPAPPWENASIEEAARKAVCDPSIFPVAMVSQKMWKLGDKCLKVGCEPLSPTQGMSLLNCLQSHHIFHHKRWKACPCSWDTSVWNKFGKQWPDSQWNLEITPEVRMKFNQGWWG